MNGKNRKDGGALSPRAAALETLLAVAQGEHLDAALERILPAVGRDDDRRLATEIAYGVLRWRGQLDPILERFSSKPISSLDPAVREVLRIGLYQLLYLDRIPPHAAVGESVQLLGPKPLRGYANAVLRRAAAEAARGELRFTDFSSPAALARTASLPGWFATRLWSRLGPDRVCEAAKALNEPPPRHFRVNTAKIDRAMLLEELGRRGIEASACRYSPAGIELDAAREAIDGLQRDGLGFIQDEASQLIPYLVAPESGTEVLDLCAAPGGKTLGLALIQGSQANVVAVDRSERRLARLRDLAKRLNITGINTVTADVRKLPPAISEKRYDRVLFDPPCSAMGTLRRNPDARWSRSERDLVEYGRGQRELLDMAWALVKSGGRLVYSVCSLEPEETSEVIEPFLRSHPECVVPIARNVLESALGRDSARSVAPDDGRFFLTTPWNIGTDGFFAAVLEKR